MHRWLRLFTEVQPGEAGPALLLLANIFLVLTAYCFIKPAREGWLVVAVVGDLSKIEIKAYSSFAQAMVLFLLIPLYARFAERWTRRQLVARVGLFFLITLLLFWVFHPGHTAFHVPYLGVVFYVWVGIFAVTLVAQFWSFAADLYGEGRGKRLFPLIAVGASSGAVSGSWISEQLVKHWQVETLDLLLYAAVPLTMTLGVAHYVDRHGVTKNHAGAELSEQPAAADGSCSSLK